MEDDINNINEIEETHFFYFIESHEISKDIKISLSSNNPQANSLERVEESTKKRDESKYTTSIYRIISSNKKDESLKIISDDNSQERNEVELSELDPSKNAFLFDLNSNLNLYESKLSLNEEFEIFSKYIIENYNKDSPEFKDLIMSTIHHLINNEKGKIQFTFYISLLIESYNSKNFINVLEIFSSDKIKDNENEEISQKDQNEFKKMMDFYQNNPKIEGIEDEKKNEELLINLFTIIYFFCFKCYKEGVKNMQKNKVIKVLIYKGLAKHKPIIANSKLPKNIIEKLIKYTNSQEDMINALSYNRDFLVLLQIINEKIELFNEKIDGSENSLINIENLIIPKREDDMSQIKSEIQNLFSNESKFNKKFVKFSQVIFDKYINYFESKNLENMEILNNIINEVKTNRQNFNLKTDMDFINHENTINLAKEHKLSNLEILNFIKNDKFYNSDEYKQSKFRPAEIISGINIYEINQEFILKWKEIDFEKIFDLNYYDFASQVCRLDKHIANFSLFLELLNTSKDPSKKEYNYQSISLLQKTFEILFVTYSPGKCPNFYNDIINLIYYSDQQNYNCISFNKQVVQKLLNNNILNKIYFTVLSKFKDLSDVTIEIITDYFTQSTWNDNVSIILDLIKTSEKVKKSILKKINKYVIREDEFFEIEETNNYKLLSNLLKTNNFYQKENVEPGLYLEKSMLVLSSIMQKVKSLDINYSLIAYMIDNSKVDILYDRLLTIFLLNANEAKEQKDILIKNVELIKIALSTIQTYLEKISLFYPNKYYKEIIDLNSVVKQIKLGTIDSYIKKYSYSYNNYITKLRDDVEKIGRRSESSFFISIYNDIKSKNMLDDENCFKKAIKSFEKIKDIFTKNKLEDSNENIVQMCLKPFKNKEEELKKEIDIDVELLNISKVKNKLNLYEDLVILLKKEDMLHLVEAIKIFIAQMGVNKGTFSKDLDYMNQKFERRKVKKIQKSIDMLSKYEITYDTKNPENNKEYLNILLLIRKQPKSIEFLNQTSLEDCRRLQELPGLFDNGFLSVNDILDLEKCIDFMQKFVNSQPMNKLKDIELINKFKEEVDKYKDISLHFTRFINNFAIINEMIKNGLDRAEMSKNKVSLILQKCEITISNNKDKFFNCFYFDENRNNENDLIPSNLSLKDLFDLRDRAQLNRVVITQGDNNAQEKEKIILNNKKFIELVSEINNLYGLLQEIYWKGFPKEFIVKIKAEYNNILFEIDKKVYNTYEEAVKTIRDILNSINQEQLIGYRDRKLVRYFFGLQFNYFYNIVNEPKQKHLFKLIPFLKYSTNELVVNNLQTFNYKTSKNTYKDIIINCDRYLNKILKLNNLTYDQIYRDSIIEKKPKIGKYKGIYTYLCENLEKDIFQIFKYLTTHNPIAQNILLCNKETTNEEIISFLYRAILCEFNSCFILGGIESLNFDKKVTFFNIINNLYVENNKKMQSFLLILYINKTSDIYKWLELEKTIKKLDLDKKLYADEKYDSYLIELIYSDKSGVGKSTIVKTYVKDQCKKYIYFPLGGVLKRDEILMRLQRLELDDNCIIHLDLFDSDEISLMMEFLFSVLITNLYRKDENVFYLSKKIEVKVEIPNSFIDYFAKFPLLNLFRKRKLSIDKLAPLIVSSDITSNIQIVCNYLKDLRENRINTKDLFFPGITPEVFKTMVYWIGKRSFSTVVDAVVLSQEQCQQLIFDTIKTAIPKPTYYQINSFIDVLAVQFKKFNQNYFLNARQLRIKNVKAQSIRTFIIESFIKLTKHFTEGAFTDLLKSQEETHKAITGKYDEDEDINNAVQNLAINEKKEIISFNKIDPSLLFFHEGEGQLFSIITNKNKSDKEYKDLLDLQNSQAIKKKDFISELPNYRKYTQKQFLKELKDILELPNPVERGVDERISLEEIAGNYVFTADNFVKMALILIRIRSNIPVIMMGETGCGKTSLIRKLSELKNDGNGDKMKILNIHAGTTDKDIIDFITNKVLNEACDLAIKEVERKFEYTQRGQLFEEKKIWVFLDEINTCKSMGLISELMCKHTYQGNELPSNVVFIAACNPYRQRVYKGKDKVGLNINQAHQQKKYLSDKELEDIKRKQNNNLVYTVNPLPHSLLNFVFDFGTISPEDEEHYIRCMIKESIEKKFNENRGNFKDSDLNKLLNLSKDLIVICQNFIRQYNDVSSVSLREIRRFNIFYEFFYDYIKIKKKNENTNQTQTNNNIFIQIGNTFSLKGIKELDIHISAINLSIFVCYYMRITNKSLREELHKKLNKKISEYEDFFNGRDFLTLPLNEERYIADNIQIEAGIAKNKALLENIFSLFVAINNKVPIFIVGKPGCSKSLSVQLITKSMRGYLSPNPLFKELPKVIVNSYQGSMGSTSEGVENVFKKARKVIQDIDPSERDKNISMIFFDEMGLAEHSPNNPLKVIHAELEYDQNEGDKKVAFVGISNWTLDASKMNRGIYISIPEPDEEDMKETALTIGKSYNEILAEKYRVFFENLGKTYYEYKKYLKEKHNLDGKEDFHGNRDFYYLVKNASINLSNAYNDYHNIGEDTFCVIGIEAIERNFSGIEFEDNGKTITSLEIIKGIYKQLYPAVEVCRKYNVTLRLLDNIHDINSRYLLVISNSSISTFLLSTILSDTKQNFSLFIGSEFQDDHKSEEYSLKVLNKVQLHMEQGNILILNNLESVYPNLYDLFNQNFSVVGNKNYARLAVGSTTNTFSYVNVNFRCIVNVDIEQIENEEAPFLNRFEKHILSYEFLLCPALIQESKRIKEVLDSITKINKKVYKGINYDFSKLLINSSLEEIQGILYEASKKNVPFENMIDEVLIRISLILPQDIFYSFYNTNFFQKYPDIVDKIKNYYERGEHTNIANFVQKLHCNKNVVYTFSHNLDGIENIKNIDNPTYGHFERENIFQIEISSIKTENELERQLDLFYCEDKYKICLIKLRPHEGRFMNYLKFFIEYKERGFELNKNDQNNTPKIFIFIIHVVRIFDSELKNFNKKSKKEQNEIHKKILYHTLSNLSDYYQVFIDNLSGSNELSVGKIIKMKRDELFLKCLDIDRELLSSVYTSLSYINYNIISSVKDLGKNNYINKFMHFIRHNAKVRKLINECIIRQIMKEEDIITKIFKKADLITPDDVDLPSIIIKYLSSSYARQLNLFIFKAEKDHFFSSLLSNVEDPTIIDLDKNDKKKKKKKKKDNIIDTSTKNNIDSDDEIDYEEDIKTVKKESLWDDEEDNEGIWKRDIFEITKEVYLERLMFNDGKTRITERPGANNLEIILGLKLPGLKTTIDRIIKKVREEVVPKYFKNEDDLRRNVNKDEQLVKDINYYKEELKRLNNITNLEIENQEILNLIVKGYSNSQEESYIFYDLLLNDYYTLFINNNMNKSDEEVVNNNNENNNENNNGNNIENNNEINNNIEPNNNNNNENKMFDKNQIENIKRMLKLLVDLKNKYSPMEYDNIKKLGNIINWIEVYSVEIISILKMYITLNKIVPNLYEQIKTIMDKNQVFSEVSERNPEHKELVNKAFFMGLESLLRVVTSNENIYIGLKEDSDKFFELINIDKQLHQDGLQLNTSFSLYSKEVFSLQEILIIAKAFEVQGISSEEKIEHLTNTIKFFSKQTILMIKQKKSKLVSNLEKLYQFLVEKIKDNEKFGEIINAIFLNEFNKIIYDEYRQKIIEFILKDNNLIANSTEIMSIIINNTLNHSIEGIISNLDIIYDSKSKIIKMLNDSKKIFLDEIIINIFETKINLYFDLIPYSSEEKLEKYFKKFSLDRINDPENKTGIILEQSFYAFRKYVEYLELAALGKKKKHNSHLIKLYTLTYVKVYLSRLVYFIKEKYRDLGDITGIMKVIKCKEGDEGKKQNNFRKVLKIYFFKLLNSLCNNYEEFQNFDFIGHKIDFADELKIREKSNQAQDLLTNYFIPLDSDEIYEKFKQQFKDFDFCRRNKFPLNQTKLFADYIRKNNLDMFIAMSLNKIISNLGLRNVDPIKKNDYRNFSAFTKALFTNEIHLDQNLINLLNLFCDESSFNSKIKPKLVSWGNINQKLFEIVLYGFRYCVRSLSAKENYNANKFLYESLLKNNCFYDIKGSYFPGNDYLDDLHINSLEEIENHLNTLPDNHGCYVCSCGYYYAIEPCGFPSKGNTSNCPVCKLKIGWGPKVVQKGYSQHGMVIRPGHYRIYKNADQKRACESRYGDPSENIPNKLLADYKRDIVEPLLKQSKTGLSAVAKERFEKRDNKIRKISPLTFRLLNFINYSHLFFANCLGYITSSQLENNFLAKGYTITKMLEKDWDLMKELLNQKGIQSVQIFMNLIFIRVSKLINNCPYLQIEFDRNIFEEQIEEVVNQSIKEYHNYSIKYNAENKNQLSFDNYDIRAIICELNPPEEKIYSKKEYPLLKYFMLTKYKNMDDFIKKLGPKNEYVTRYPLLGQYLLNKPGPKKMKFLPDFNEFTNYMVDNYSFKISRDAAKKRPLEKEPLFSDNNFKNKYNKFIDSWNGIKEDAIKYKCRGEMPVKTLSKSDPLVCFLNDDGELLNGMYLAAACQNFISWQNTFLQPIIDTVIHNGILHYYVNNLKKKIPVQTAKVNQTLLLEDSFKKSQYINFDELYYTFSKRDIFREDGTINYLNYNSFKYDYNKIEEEFGKVLLPGLCLFDNEDNLNFVTYWSEGFRGGKSDTLSTFYLKYPQKDLNSNEKQIINDYINNLLSERHNYDFKGFFGSLQLLLFYLANNDVKKGEKISNIINQAPPYLKITADCINFFNNEGNMLILDKLMNIFFFIEHLCFNDLVESLQPEYQKEIPEDVEQRIREKLLVQRNHEDVYTIGDLAAAVRRYISRYLVGKRQTTDIDENRDLAYDLSRTDLWSEKIGRLDNLDELITTQLYEFGLKVSQALELYRIIEEEDKTGISNFDNDRNNRNYFKDFDLNNNNININDNNNNNFIDNNNNNIIDNNENNNINNTENNNNYIYNENNNFNIIDTRNFDNNNEENNNFNIINTNENNNLNIIDTRNFDNNFNQNNNFNIIDTRNFNENQNLNIININENNNIINNNNNENNDPYDYPEL